MLVFTKDEHAQSFHMLKKQPEKFFGSIEQQKRKMLQV